MINDFMVKAIVKDKGVHNTMKIIESEVLKIAINKNLSITKNARVLGVCRNSLKKKLKSHNIPTRFYERGIYLEKREIET